MNQIFIKQSKDAVLQQLKAKLLDEVYSENILQRNARYRHYANNLERIVEKEETLTRQYFDKAGNMKYHQNFSRYIYSENCFCRSMGRPVSTLVNRKRYRKFNKSITNLAWQNVVKDG